MRFKAIITEDDIRQLIDTEVCDSMEKVSIITPIEDLEVEFEIDLG